MSLSPKHERMRYSEFVWPVKDCNREPFDLSKRRILLSREETRRVAESVESRIDVTGSVCLYF